MEPNYPKRTYQDDLKYIYQAYNGPEHMVVDEAKSYQYLLAEMDDLNEPYTIQKLNDHYVRFHFHHLDEIEAKVLTRLFVLSCGESDEAAFKQAIDNYAKAHPELTNEMNAYKEAGYPSVHHSDIFRNTYKPHYRVLLSRYALYFDLICDVMRNSPYLIGIDGRCGSGKSTLGKLISDVFDCPLIHMDDFYLPMALRTPERYATPGGNVHYERVKEEVIDPIRRHEPFDYGIFTHTLMDVGSYKHESVSDHYVVEGSYSFNDALKDAFDYRIFLTIEPDHQIERIRNRNGEEVLKQFIDRWIPLEELYFTSRDFSEDVDAYINVTELTKNF